MKNKTLLTLLGLTFIVLIASGCTSTTPQNQQNNMNNQDIDQEPTDTDSDKSKTDNKTQYTVTYTDSGFQPSTLTIQKGDTVVWENEASSSMWVASNDHPTHTKYAGTSRIQHCPDGGNSFDQCGTGDTYSFTFNKRGTWGYHNHQPYARGGKIIVE